MNAPLPSPSTITVKGRRQQSDASPAPTHATKPAVSAPAFISILLHLFRSERPVLERQPVRLAAASDGVSRRHVLGKRHNLVALGATDPVGEGRGPTTAVLPDAQGLPGAVRALHQVTRPRSLGQLDGRAAIRATNQWHQPIPKSRCNFPRSNPTT